MRRLSTKSFPPVLQAQRATRDNGLVSRVQVAASRMMKVRLAILLPQRNQVQLAGCHRISPKENTVLQMSQSTISRTTTAHLFQEVVGRPEDQQVEVQPSRVYTQPGHVSQVLILV